MTDEKITDVHASAIAASEAITLGKYEEARERLAKALLDLIPASENPDLVRALGRLVKEKPERSEVTIARILATQYYRGWSNPKKCEMSRDEYIAHSLLNWIDAARGIINIIKNPDILNRGKNGSERRM